MKYKQRLARFRRALAADNLDGFLIAGRENIRYLSGFPGDDSWALVTADSARLLTDFRYREEARGVLPPCWELVLRDGETLAQTSAFLFDCLGTGRFGFEGRRLVYSDFEILNHTAENNPGMELVPCAGLIEKARMIKDEDEIGLIAEAARIGDGVLGWALSEFRIGMRECEFAALLIAGIRKAGGRPGFEPIVASGPRSSRPHARTSARSIGAGEILLVDMGVNIRGYNSDMTRTFFIEEVSFEFEKIYLLLLEAEKRVMESIADGRKASAADETVREYLREEGYGSFFGHALGHGVGLEVHEKPSLSCRAADTFREGMTFTIEPGVYRPGDGGVRVEDTVLLGCDGCRPLTKFPKDLNSMVITEK